MNPTVGLTDSQQLLSLLRPQPGSEENSSARLSEALMSLAEAAGALAHLDSQLVNSPAVRVVMETLEQRQRSASQCLMDATREVTRAALASVHSGGHSLVRLFTYLGALPVAMATSRVCLSSALIGYLTAGKESVHSDEATGPGSDRACYRVFAHIDNWSYGKMNPIWRQVNGLILAVVHPDDIQQALTEALPSAELENAAGVNKISLQLVSAGLTAFQWFRDFIKNQTCQLLQSAFERHSQARLFGAIALARQTAACSADLNCRRLQLSGYGDWLSRQFSRDVCPIRSKKSLGLLLSVYFASLEFDTSAQALLAQINHPPASAHFSIRELFDPYAQAARARVRVIAPSEAATEASPAAEQALADVERAARQFADSGRVPTFVTELALLRRAHFVGAFLPALLRPRLLPEPPDARHRLAVELRSMGKVPEQAYVQYVAACQRERDLLLSGLDDEQAMDFE